MRKSVLLPLVLAAAVIQAGVHAEGPLVGIDVLASSAGGSGAGRLDSADLSVAVDGVPVAIEPLDDSLERGPQVYGIFLDEYHVAEADAARVRDAMTRFVEGDMRPGDRAVVLKPLDSLVSISLTADRNSLVQAISSFSGRLADYTPRTSFEARFVARSPAIADATRAQMSWSAAGALSRFLAGAGEGRKTLVIVSGGIGPVSGRRRGLGPEGPTAVAKLANGGNVAVYVVDPTVETPVGRDGRSSTANGGSSDLAELADETGGRTISGADLDTGLQTMATDARAYYWLQWKPADEDDGRFHSVTVTTKKANVSLRMRPGYWARSAADEKILAAASTPPPPAPPVEMTHASSLIRSWFGFSRGRDGKTQVTFVWEPVPRVPGIRSREPEPSQVVFEALGADGTSIFQATVPPSSGAGEEEAGPPAQAVFEAPPGRVRLKMSIEGGAEELDHDIRSIAVRQMSGPVVLGSPEVFRTRTARDWRLLEADPKAAPVVAREFSRTERIAIRFAVYADGGVNRSAVLKGADGQVLRTLDVVALPARPNWFQADVQLASLANGDYSIEVGASGPAGQAKELVSFRVTN